MIPKIIHYCWFGRKPLPTLAVKCINSWKRYLPNYEIKEWNEDNFDVNSISYTQEAYEEQKYAFVSDYARFYILYHYGGLYFDTDVEIIKPLDDIIDKGPFMGCEDGASIMENRGIGVTAFPVITPGFGLGCNPGLGLGCNPGLDLYAEILSLYAGTQFRYADGRLNLKTVVEYVTELLCQYGLKNVNDIQFCAGIWIYPQEYFCPISIHDGKLRISANTRTIHHYAQSWQSPIRKYGRKVILIVGGQKLKHLIKKVLYKR